MSTDGLSSLDLKSVSKVLGLNKINSAGASDTTTYAIITSLLLVVIITTISVFIWIYHERIISFYMIWFCYGLTLCQNLTNCNFLNNI